jgi:hypothetical protein
MHHDLDELIAAANPVPADAFTGAASDPAATAQFERIVGSDLRPPRPTRRRVAVVLAGTLLAGAAWTTAEARGIVPNGVMHAFGKMRHEPGTIGQLDLTKAHMVARMQEPGGSTVEYWEAPNSGDGVCRYLRELPRDGGKEDGSMECDIRVGAGLIPTPEMIRPAVEHTALGGIYVYGSVPVPGAVKVRVDFDGLPSQDFLVRDSGAHGYFLAMTPWLLPMNPTIKKVTAFDQAGAAVSTSGQ